MSSKTSLIQEIPFPCVVYRRERAGGVYKFSHTCSTWFHKTFPATLRVKDMRAYHHSLNWANIRNTCFMVLVAGDVAQAISVSTHAEKRTPFLYSGSTYDTQSSIFSAPTLLHTEFQESYIPLRFYGTLAAFDSANCFQCAIPIESGISLFPCQVCESDIMRLSKWVDHAVNKAMHSSMWVTNAGHKYNEHTLRLFTG